MSSCVPHCHPAPASRCVAACTQDGKRHRGTCQSLSLQGLGSSSSSGSTGPGHLYLPPSLPQDRQGGCCALKQLAAVRPCQTHIRARLLPASIRHLHVSLTRCAFNTKWFLLHCHARLRGCRSFRSAASLAGPRRRGCRAVGRGDTAPCY